jgi:hypothetical protein
LLGHGVHSSLKNEEQYYVESKGTTHSSIHICNKSRTMHQKDREDENPTYESLVNLEEYHSKIHHGKVQILTHIKASSGRTAVRNQCCDESCDRQQLVINWRNHWTGNLKKQIAWKNHRSDQDYH